MHQDLAGYVARSQRYVTGSVRMKLYKGSAVVSGRRAQHSLYDHSLATYNKGDSFDHKAAEGFIGLFALPLQTQAHTQWLGRSSDEILELSAGTQPLTP